jgi:hypothetical protein
MYFTGIDHPDREPGRNRYTEEKRRSKFTEDVAATVTDGDLYFSKRTPAHQRFYVPVENGEHGLEVEEGALICVTHVFKQPFPDIKGRWQEYDRGGNLVIKVRSGDDESIGYQALEAIEQALYRTPLGRAVGREGVRKQAESLCKTFGIERDRDDAPSTFTVNTDAEKMAQDALRDLLTFAPEGGYYDELGPIFADADGFGFAEDGEEYANLINGRTDGFGTKHDGRGRDPLPLMSQPVFYGVLGSKGDGRSFQGRITRLMEAVGLEEDDLR